MIKVNLRQAKAHLSEYLADLASGRENVIVLCKRNKSVAEIRLLATAKKRRPRKLGTAKGQIQIKASFFDPLTEDMC